MRSAAAALQGARWVEALPSIEAPVILRSFDIKTPSSARIAVSSLGFFKLYINGERVGDEYFLPSNSLFCERPLKDITYPIKDKFTYRTYFTEYDILPFVKSGENTLEIKLGGGWFRQNERVAEGDMSFGDALAAIYAITVTDADGERDIISDGTELCRESETVYSNLFHGETVDMRISTAERYPVKIIDVDTILTPEDAPADREIRRIYPDLILSDGDRRIYDCRENVSGFAVITHKGNAGDRVTLRYAENFNGEALDFLSTGSNYISKSGKPQIMTDTFISNGGEHIFEPEFTWHAFRYVEVTGDIADIFIKVIHSDVEITGDFESSSPELNWLYTAYLRTQLDNMHGGVPSDCPHRERLGYTGDGQVCAPAAMLTLDGRAFYRKWIRDIFDSQDKLGGHINHTAPFAGGGGGPGGWGMAAVTVPYNYYKIYGDPTPLKENYDRIMLWIDYLAEKSEDGLITKEEDGGWCLGDWSTLEKCSIPEPYVNTCLFIKAVTMLESVCETRDLEKLKSLRFAAEAAVKREYYDAESGSFANGIQGADAYAIYAGIADGRTLDILNKKYDALGHFDTGFIGTDILCGVLIENGCCDTAYKLLTSHDMGGFGYFMDNGLTTLPEHFRIDGSYCHPMFGGAVRHLYTSVLGIRQKDGDFGYKSIVISPKIPKTLKWARGKIRTECGDICVCFECDGDTVSFSIALPEGIDAEFEFNDKKEPLCQGESKIQRRRI